MVFTYRFFILLVFALVGAGSCSRAPETASQGILDPTQILNDPEYQLVYQLQDQLNVAELTTYFSNDNPNLRYAAAMAFGSMRDSSALPSLAQLLQDPVVEVRQAAAYALGQIGSIKAEKALIEAFDRYDSLGTARPVNAAILEAIGKCGSKESLRYLATIKSYKPSDTLLLEGQARGILRFALRGKLDSLATQRMVTLATEVQYPSSVRRLAAHYLARAAVKLDTFARILAPMAPKESNVDIRMALASALGKAARPYVVDTLRHWFPRESDYRVRINILKAMVNHNYLWGRATVFQALKDPNTLVAQQASQYLLDHGQPKDAGLYWQLAKDSTLHWQIQANLLAAAQRYLPPSLGELRDKLNYQHRKRFELATSPYAKAAFLRSLAWFGWNYRFIFREGEKSKALPVRTAAWEALATIDQRPDFDKHFGLGARRVAKELAALFRYALLKADAGAMAPAAQALRTPGRNNRLFFTSAGFLDTALTRLKLPAELETYHEVQMTRNFFRGAPLDSSLYRYDPTQHPPNWEILNTLNDNPVAVIKTNKGEIRIALLPQFAPATVASFVSLVKSEFYTKKTFHRVVPNFVVQGGCPRGDGYGSTPFALRSETPPQYYDAAGMVGMASAGPHTEGPQFFITHSPTPHLDGRYTLFGRVTQGMAVVQTLQVGDLIEKVTIE